MKSIIGQYIHWNQEIKPQDDIRDPKIKSKSLEEKIAK
jgi:hypothetical protein